MTLLTIVNKVMRRIREEPVSSLAASEYGRLIGEFVSEIHQEVALCHDWGSGYKIVEFETIAGSQEYNLAELKTKSAGSLVDGSGVTNENSEPVFGGGIYLYSTTSEDKPLAEMYLTNPATYDNIVAQDRGYEARPCYVKLTLQEDGTGYGASLYPIPDQAYRVRVPFWIPENVLATDGTDDSTVLALPSRPIELGTLWLALNERGEELGEPGNVAERRYYDALDKAIAADTKPREFTNRYDAYRD